MKVGILLGSSRPHGNSHGLSAWLIFHLQKFFSARSGRADLAIALQFVNIYPNQPVHPLGPVLDDTISAMVKNAEYSDPNVREWSKIVSSCDGFVVLTPQYNWGYPGDLKNAIDHLYHEWNGKPLLLATYGGRGGGKCSQQLREVLQGGLHLDVVNDEISIVLPSEYIRDSTRVAPIENDDYQCTLLIAKHGFLQEYVAVVQTAAESFFTKLDAVVRH